MTWRRHVDRQSFRQEVRESTLSQPSLSLNADERFELRRIAPERTVRNRVQPLSPWYDAECWTVRGRCRRLERLYRRTGSDTDTDRLAWVAAERQKHVNFAAKKNY